MLPLAIRLTLAALCCAVPVAGLAAAPVQEAQGQPRVEAIEVSGGGEREADIRAAIQQEVGRPLDPEAIRRSEEWLWKYQRVRVERVERRGGSSSDAVVLVFHVVPLETWRRAVFLGNRSFDRTELELWAGLVGQPLDSYRADLVRDSLLRQYREEGYAHARVEVEAGEGDEVIFRIEEGAQVTIERIHFVGNEAIRSGKWYTPGLDLYGALKNRTGGWFSGAAYNPLKLQEDSQAIAELYRDYGYLEVQVSHEVAFRGPRQAKADVTYTVVEGPLYSVGSVSLESIDGSPLRFPEEQLRALMELKEGDPYEKARVVRDRLALQKYYGDAGHPTVARVVTVPGVEPSRFLAVGGRRAGQDAEARLDEVGTQVDLVFVIQEGTERRLRDVVVRGNQRTEDRVVRREIINEPGDLVNEEDAVRSLRRLIGLGYFTDELRNPYVNWYWQDFGDQDMVDLVFEVTDLGSNNRLRFGGSWNSDNGPALLIDLTKTNFDITDTPDRWQSALTEIWNGTAFTGAGQSLGISIRPGTIFSSYSLSFTEPDLLKEHIDRLSLSVVASRNLRFFPTHDEERDVVGFTLGRRFGRYFTVFAGPEAQIVDLDDIDPGAPTDLTDFAGKNRFRTFTVGARWNTIGDPFAPVDGEKLGMSVGQSGRFMGGDWDFVKATVSGEKYFPLYEDSLRRNWVLSTSGRVRRAWVSGDLTSLPYPEKFFVGGQNDVRGFQFRGVGEDVRGFARGGDAAWNASVELRFPLVSTRQRGLVDEFEMVRGGIFVDAGTFGPDFGNLDPVRVSTGVALRIRFPALPTAPLSLDFGWPLKSEDGDDTRVFSFTIGNF